MLSIIKNLYKSIVRTPRGRDSFLAMIKQTCGGKGALLDCGCGNNSPYIIKSRLPDIFYVGIDVGEYNQTKSNLADQYIITEPDQFAMTISTMANSFDVVISSHNLEHCNNREATLLAMIRALKHNGYMYLSFPCEESIAFPSRKGTLNYYDDLTHQYTPPKYDEIIEILRAHGMTILFACRSYKPILAYLSGLLLEPLSRIKKKVYTAYGTWAFWGFETVIWAKKQRTE